MAAGAVAIWAAVLGIAVYVARVRPEAHRERAANLLILGGGVVVPTVVLAGLLAYGLSLMPRSAEAAGDGREVLEVEVSGEQWWWRVRYRGPGGEAVELANEVHLPVGEPVRFLLTSPDVIHSFWIPSLGGKMDMIPGRTTRLLLEPTRTGVYRGACAEYCGASHAWMAFYAVVEEREAFEAWLRRQRASAREPAGPLQERGRDLFLANGCGACHAVRGTPADGVVGPDLTHVGSRLSLAAGTLAGGAEPLGRWLTRPEAIKPGVHMPAFGMLPAEDLRALAAYLESLE